MPTSPVTLLGHRADFARRYQAINIKLDKTGGLTAAMDLFDAAQRRRAARDVWVHGCDFARASRLPFHIARHCAFVDLDGPVWLKEDRVGGVRMEGGT